MADRFEGHQAGLESPADFFAAITPSDDTDLVHVARALWIQGEASGVSPDRASGIVFYAVTVRSQTGQDATFIVPEGTMLPVRAKRVLATGTNAPGIIALW